MILAVDIPIDRTNVIIFLLGQCTMFVVWLVRMDATGTRAGKWVIRQVEMQFKTLEDRVKYLEERINHMSEQKR